MHVTCSAVCRRGLDGKLREIKCAYLTYSKLKLYSTFQIVFENFSNTMSILTFLKQFFCKQN